MKPIKPLEVIDFDTNKFNEIRITIYPKKENGKHVIILCVINRKTLLYSTEVGYFVEVVPCIVKHLHVHPKLSKEGYPTTTIVPTQSFRVVKMPMSSNLMTVTGGYSTRVCIIPPKALDGKIRIYDPEIYRLEDLEVLNKKEALPKVENGETRIFAIINKESFVVDVPTIFVSEIKQNNDVIDKKIFNKIDAYRKKIPIFLIDEPDMMTGWNIDTSMDEAFVKAFLEEEEE